MPLKRNYNPTVRHREQCDINHPDTRQYSLLFTRTAMKSKGRINIQRDNIDRR